MIKIYCIFLEGIKNNIHSVCREYMTDDKLTAQRQIENELSIGGCVPLITYTEEELNMAREDWLKS